MKKKILFVCCDMRSGGVQKSLISLLNTINYDDYDVDLFLFRQDGLFMSQLPTKVNLLNDNPRLRELWKQKHYVKVLRAYFAGKVALMNKNLSKRWGVYWKGHKGVFRTFDTKYDVAIAYNDGVELFYVVDCVEAKKKIGFNHSEYSNPATYKPELDRKYYHVLDKIVCVSTICEKKLIEYFPEIQSKTCVIENIVSKELLKNMSEEKKTFDAIRKNDNIKIIVTVARLDKKKGFDIAIKALSLLKSEGINFKWYIIGVGPDEQWIKDMVELEGLCDDIVFLYEQANPYCYVKNADIFMLTSYFEGKSIAVEEAKLLEMPILITRYGTAENQIEDEITGLIAEFEPNDIKEQLKRLMTDEELVCRLKYNLKYKCHSNEKENIEKIYSLIEG